MADQLQELMDIPKDFARDGTLFLNKCTKRKDILFTSHLVHMLTQFTADRREFLQISKAVGVGFLIMGTVGFLVKLSELSGLTACGILLMDTVHIPVNQILVG
jgi:protein transport protein SEC61 subunit gamma-like protein